MGSVPSTSTTVHASPARDANAETTARSFGDVSYWKTFCSSQPSRAARGKAILKGRLKPGMYAVQAAATAASASLAFTSTMAM